MDEVEINKARWGWVVCIPSAVCRLRSSLYSLAPAGLWAFTLAL